MDRTVNLVCNRGEIIAAMRAELAKHVDSKDRLWAQSRVWGCGSGGGLVNADIARFIVECQYIHHFWIYQNCIEELGVI
jgi:hypothetical protein